MTRNVLFIGLVVVFGLVGCRTKNARRAVPQSGTPTTQLNGDQTSVPGPCELPLLLDSEAATDAAAAMDICEGVTSASWTLPDGTKIAANPSTDVTQDPSFHLGHGLLNNFGANVTPKAGTTLLALSTGAARGKNDPGFFNPTAGLTKDYEHALAGLVGFPSLGDRGFQGSGCVGSSTTGADGIALNVNLTAPAGATGFTFQYKYHTGDYTFSICSDFADQAAALFGSQNLLKTSLGNDLNSNTQDLEACVAEAPYTCPLGTDALLDTGFRTGAATGWRTSPVTSVSSGQSFTLRFTIWDSGDGLSDSTLLLDNFRWR